MSAKEIFEKANASYFENNERITIEFYNRNSDDYDFIEFDKQCKTLSVSIDQFSLRKYNFDFETLFQAINKQIEELCGDEILKKNGNK